MNNDYNGHIFSVLRVVVELRLDCNIKIINQVKLVQIPEDSEANYLGHLFLTFLSLRHTDFEKKFESIFKGKTVDQKHTRLRNTNLGIHF